MIVCVDVQHIGKRTRVNDRGAFSFGHTEVFFTEQYGRKIAEILREKGHEVHFSAESLVDYVLDGNYGERHEFSNSVKADLYLACHVNAGAQADYSLVEHQVGAWERTTWLATMVAKAFKDRIPTEKAYVKSLGSGDRGYSCIDGVRTASALLLEPFFIDNEEDHRFAATPGGIKTIAMCVTDFIPEWVERFKV